MPMHLKLGRPTDSRPVLPRLIFISFFLGVAALFGYVNLSFLMQHSESVQHAYSDGAYSQTSLYPGNEKADRRRQSGGGGSGGKGSDVAQRDPPAPAHRWKELVVVQRPKPRRSTTLVVYVYNARDAEEEKNFQFFLRYGVREGDGVTYVILVARGHGVLVG